MELALCEMQAVSSRIWTRVTVSIPYDDNHHTMLDFSQLLMYSSNDLGWGWG